MNQRKMKRVIDIIFLVLIFIFGVLFIDTLNNDEAGIGLLAGNFFVIIITISSYIGIILAMKKHRMEKLDKIDFGKYKDYYRDILQEYSPAVYEEFQLQTREHGRFESARSDEEGNEKLTLKFDTGFTVELRNKKHVENSASLRCWWEKEDVAEVDCVEQLFKEFGNCA